MTEPFQGGSRLANNQNFSLKINEIDTQTYP